MKRTSHLCLCRDCGATHVRPKLPAARCCRICFAWLPMGSRAQYCGDACRQRGREERLARLRAERHRAQA